MKDHGTGGGVNPDIPPHPLNDELMAQPRDDDGTCRYCKTPSMAEHRSDCPWRQRLYANSDETGAEKDPSAPHLWVIGADSGIGKHAVEMGYDFGFNDVVATGVGDCDVTSAVQVEEFVNDHPPFDGVLYCAGVNALDWSASIKEQDLYNIFDINVLGFIRVIRELAKSQPGHLTSIVAITSDAGKLPMRTSMAYCASKAALDMAVKVAAREHAAHWRVNGVAPSAVEGTEMTHYVDGRVPDLRGWLPSVARAHEMASSAIGRRVTMGEVASLAFQIMTRQPAAVTGSIQYIGGK